MSCIAGIINLDGAPVERELLERMTRTMKDRAPDEIGIWCSGNVGFGHALLRISPESANEHQPRTLDNKVWITADARIDGRTELIAKLRSAGESIQSDAPDIDLILHAYRAHGESFLEYLIGDFAFALWDGQHKKLFCARDHFGVRPFFYASTDQVLLFASDIDALLVHPSVTKQLDETAVADFILFGSYLDNAASIYKDIRRLPPANQLRIRRNQYSLEPYWVLPAHDEIRFRHDSEYVEQFQDIFEQAVNDRSRTKKLALELSGGMDSTSIAATAAAGRRHSDRTITAYTTTCTGLLPDDQEGQYAGVTASFLGIPIVYQASENYRLFQGFDDPRLSTSEPVAHPDLAAHLDNYWQIVNSGARLLLTGQGGDAVFNGSTTYYSDLLRRGRLLKFLVEAHLHVRSTRSVRGMGLRSILIFNRETGSWRPPLPDWIAREFARHVDIESRWDRGWEELNGVSDAYHQLKRPWISQTFEAYDALKMPLIAAHPFFDLRLIKFLLGVPNYMKDRKRLMREAMTGKLPSSILTRPKTSLAGDQFRVKMGKGLWGIPTESRPERMSKRFFVPEAYRSALDNYMSGKGNESTWSSALMITPLALDNWLECGRLKRNQETA